MNDQQPLAEMIDTLTPITLPELNAQAELMSRFDSKYFVPRSTLAELLDGFAGDTKVLEIENTRSFLYRTVYFDSPNFRFYRDHVQRKRHRFKVRTRTYCDTGGCMLEVKSKGYRGSTVKKRIEHDETNPEFLDAAAVGFIDSITGGGSTELSPVLETFYRRTTLALGNHRVTIDLNLECALDDAKYFGPDHALVETKSPGHSSEFDVALRSRGIRPHSVSKYCIGAALLHPELPSNPWHRTIGTYFDQDLVAA